MSSDPRGTVPYSKWLRKSRSHANRNPCLADTLLQSNIFPPGGKKNILASAIKPSFKILYLEMPSPCSARFFVFKKMFLQTWDHRVALAHTDLLLHLTPLSETSPLAMKWLKAPFQGNRSLLLSSHTHSACLMEPMLYIGVLDINTTAWSHGTCDVTVLGSSFAFSCEMPIA